MTLSIIGVLFAWCAWSVWWFCKNFGIKHRPIGYKEPWWVYIASIPVMIFANVFVWYFVLYSWFTRPKNSESHPNSD